MRIRISATYRYDILALIGFRVWLIRFVRYLFRFRFRNIVQGVYEKNLDVCVRIRSPTYGDIIYFPDYMTNNDLTNNNIR